MNIFIDYDTHDELRDYLRNNGYEILKYEDIISFLDKACEYIEIHGFLSQKLKYKMAYLQNALINYNYIVFGRKLIKDIACLETIFIYQYSDDVIINFLRKLQDDFCLEKNKFELKCTRIYGELEDKDINNFIAVIKPISEKNKFNILTAEAYNIGFNCGKELGEYIQCSAYGTCDIWGLTYRTNRVTTFQNFCSRNYSVKTNKNLTKTEMINSGLKKIKMKKHNFKSFIKFAIVVAVAFVLWNDKQDPSTFRLHKLDGWPVYDFYSSITVDDSWSFDGNGHFYVLDSGSYIEKCYVKFYEYNDEDFALVAAAISCCDDFKKLEDCKYECYYGVAQEFNKQHLNYYILHENILINIFFYEIDEETSNKIVNSLVLKENKQQ